MQSTLDHSYCNNRCCGKRGEMEMKFEEMRDIIVETLGREAAVTAELTFSIG